MEPKQRDRSNRPPLSEAVHESEPPQPQPGSWYWETHNGKYFVHATRMIGYEVASEKAATMLTDSINAAITAAREEGYKTGFEWGARYGTEKERERCAGIVGKAMDELNREALHTSDSLERHTADAKIDLLRSIRQAMGDSP